MRAPPRGQRKAPDIGACAVDRRPAEMVGIDTATLFVGNGKD